MPWSPGDIVCLRQTWGGRVWKAYACTVVERAADQLVLFSPVGSEAQLPDYPIPRDEWTLRPSLFKSHVLALSPESAGYSTLLEWNADWSFIEWYVNFERPRVPSSVGFDYFDLALDLACYADGRWKLLDEDELEEGLATGVFTTAEAAAARAEAERIIAEWPFPTGWEDWRPDPGWAPPSLSAGWDVVR